MFLSTSQKQIVMYNRQWCKATIRALRKKEQPPNAYQICLSGPGGTGKSHVINLIQRDILFFFSKSQYIVPDDPLVLLTASTGCAAFNIEGITIHSALQLNSSSSRRLSWPVRTTMVNKFHQFIY